MGDLKRRVDRLARSIRPRGRPGRLIVIQPGDGPPVVMNPAGGLTLNVPIKAGRDPEAALTAEQRARIGPDDRLIVIGYADNWREGDDLSALGGEGP